MRNHEWCIYTYRHRKMFAYIAEKLIKNETHKAAILERAKWHDVDKLLMYLLLDQDVSQKHHVEIRKHHLEYKADPVTNIATEKCYIDYLETVIDYECSPYTKPDKPLNAYDFLKKLQSMELVDDNTANILYDIMHELGIDRSYSVLEDKEGMAYAESLNDISDLDVLNEVLEYLRAGMDDVYPWIEEQLKEQRELVIQEEYVVVHDSDGKEKKITRPAPFYAPDSEKAITAEEIILRIIRRKEAELKGENITKFD